MADSYESFGWVRSIDEDNRLVTTIVSSGDIARDGAVVRVDGWDLTHYERNPVVLWAHDDRSLPIAKTVSSQRTDEYLIQTHQFATHPRAEEVFEAVRNGFVSATSVRWLPGETKVERTKGDDGHERNVLVFTRGHQLLETSYVPIPADPHAVVLRADGTAIDAGDYLVVEVLTDEAIPAAEAVERKPSGMLAALLEGLQRGQLKEGLDG